MTFNTSNLAPTSSTSLRVDKTEITPRQEHIWLQQQQDSDTILAATLAFHLQGALDTTRLIRAIEALPKAISLLGHAIQMNDEGELIGKVAQPCFQIESAASKADAIARLTAFGAAPWDVNHEAPLRSALIIVPEGAVLGLVFHAIAGGPEVADTALKTIVAHYNGNDLPDLEPLPNTAPPADLSARDPLTALRRPMRAQVAQPILLPLEKTASLEQVAQALSAAMKDIIGGVSPDVSKLPTPLPGLALSLPLEAPIVVAKLSAPVLELKGVTATPIRIPATFTGTGLLIGLREGVGMELLAGADISPMAAGLILERTAEILQSDNAIPLAISAPEPAPEPLQHTDIETIILGELRKALQDDTLGPEDDFFDFGGHSLTATRVIGRLLDQHGIEIHLSDLFSRPTAAALAKHAVATAILKHETPNEAARDNPSTRPSAPLSHAQASLWRAYAAFNYCTIFNIPFALRFLDPVDEAVFAAAFRDVLERHPVLRSHFSEDDTGPLQTIVQVEALDRYRWFWPSSEAGDASRAGEAGHVFDLSKELPLRLRFFEEDEGQVLSMLFHHVVLDEWSVGILMDDLAKAYTARAAGMVPFWQETPPPFHDFATKQHAAGPNEAHLNYWTDMLRGAPAAAPIFGQAAEQGSPAGGWVEMRIAPEITDGLYALAKTENASPFNVVYAGIAASLHWLGDIDDLLIGTSASGRLDTAYFDTVGYFTTMVAHRITFNAAQTLRGLVGEVRDIINGSMPKSDIPLDLVSEQLFGAPQPMDRIFEAFIQIHPRNPMNGQFALNDGRKIRFRQIDPDKEESILGLQFEVVEDVVDNQRNLRVMMSYRADRYDEKQVARILGTTAETFRLMATPAEAARRLSELKERAVQ